MNSALYSSMKPLVLIFCLFCTRLMAQVPGTHWAFNAGGTFDDIGKSVATDSGGNVFIAGYFEGPVISFGSFVLNNTDLSGNSFDIFLVKYNPSGIVQWAKSYGGPGADIVFCITTDPSGNVILTGEFNSNVLSVGPFNLSNAGGSDLFIAKTDNSGNEIWAQSYGSAGSETGIAITTDSAGNILFSGAYLSDSLAFGNSTIYNTGSIDFYVTKLDPAGTVNWSKGFGGFLNDVSSGITTDGSNIYVTGNYNSSSIDFGGTILTNNGSEDVYLMKLDPSGMVQWSKGAGGSWADWGQSVATDYAGNVVITGWFESPVLSFDTVTLSGNFDIFISKYDPSGNVLWAKSASGQSTDYAHAVSCDGNGNVFLTGNFLSSVLFFDGTPIVNPDINSIIVACYSTAGNFVWAKPIKGCNCGIKGFDVCNDPSGNVIITGQFNSGLMNFDTITLLNSHFPNADCFIAKFNTITSLNDPESSENSVMVIPNPASDNIQILWKALEYGVFDITLYDMTGKSILQWKANIVSGQNDRTFYLGMLPKGVYSLHIYNSSSLFRTKVVLQ